MRLVLSIFTLSLAGVALHTGGAPQLGPELLLCAVAACLVEVMSVRQPRLGTLSFALVIYAPVFALYGPSACLAIASLGLLVRETLSYSDTERCLTEILLDLFPLSAAATTALLSGPDEPPWLSWFAFGLVHATTRHLGANLLRRDLTGADLKNAVGLAQATADLRWGTLALSMLAIPLALQNPLLVLAALPVLYSFRKAAIHAYAHLDAQDKKVLRRHLKGAENQVGELSKTLETTQTQRNLLHELSKDTAHCTTLLDLLGIVERHARALKLGEQLSLLVRGSSGWVFLTQDPSGRPKVNLVDPSTLEPAYHQVWTTGGSAVIQERLYQLLPGTGVLSLRCGAKRSKESFPLLSLFCSQVSLAALSALRLEALGHTLEDLARANSELAAGNESLRQALEQLRASEAKLIESAKLAAVGQLSAGLAHEINNPLGSIRLGLESTLRKETISDFSRDMLQKGLAALQRAEQVVGSLLNYSRTESKGKVKVSVHTVTRDTVSFLGGALRLRGIQLALPTVGEGVEVYANPGEIQQVLINLLLNAKDAVEGRPHPQVALRIEVRGGCASLEVHDNGPGLDPSTRDRIFDPFFTTKPVGKGTGLGLSVSRELATSNGGTLKWFEPSALGGAAFRLQLPLLEPAAERKKAPGSPELS